MAFPLLALLLFAGDPPAADAPIAAAKPAAASAEPNDADDPYPAGAPKDDFGMVAWCDGVLAGHMDLAERVQAVLPLDPEQQKIGAAFLQGYEKALIASKEGKTEKGKARAEAARAVGWKNWDPARAADKKLASDSYLAWQMPGRCEHAAVRLSGDKDLFRMVPTLEEAQAMGEATPVAVGRSAAADAAPPPEAVARAAPAVSADAIRISTIPDAPGAAPSTTTPAADAPPPPAPAQTPPKKKGWFSWIPGVN